MLLSPEKEINGKLRITNNLKEEKIENVYSIKNVINNQPFPTSGLLAALKRKYRVKESKPNKTETPIFDIDHYPKEVQMVKNQILCTD